MVLCGTVSSFLTSKMVELVGVEPMTYTMRTYRSSQLSYSPILASSPGAPELTVYNIVIIGEIARRGKEKNVIFNGVSENSASGR